MPFFGNADGDGFVLVGIEAANDGRRRSERDLVFAGAPARAVMLVTGGRVAARWRAT